MKNLVVMPLGKDSIKSPWLLESKNRGFDVICLAYHDPGDLSLDMQSPHYRVVVFKDFKWVMIRDLFHAEPELLNQYEHFLFLDDDIEITGDDILNLFWFAQTNHLQLTQPVLTRDSFKSWKVLRRKLLSGIRYLSTVELMCPLMHRDAIVELLPTFALNRSGWGIDILWGERIRSRFGNRCIAVCDLIRARHTRPVGKGELYAKLGKSAFEERDEIFQQFKLKDNSIYELPIPENNRMEKIKSYFALRKTLPY